MCLNMLNVIFFQCASGEHLFYFLPINLGLLLNNHLKEQRGRVEDRRGVYAVTKECVCFVIIVCVESKTEKNENTGNGSCIFFFAIFIICSLPSSFHVLSLKPSPLYKSCLFRCLILFCLPLSS
uniref:Uncharacterized protein n=1 Tax=Cebus imitator TaxID=2715852 RepID=A0A2K5RXW1_CEBIM